VIHILIATFDIKFYCENVNETQVNTTSSRLLIAEIKVTCFEI